MGEEQARSGYQQERDQHVARIESEIQNLDPSQFPETRRILEEVLYDVRGGVTEFLEVQGTRKVKIRAKVAIPVEPYNNFNYVGKLLGPGGSNLKGMQEQTMTKMAILGQGSMRNADKEQEMLNSGDPKFAHLKGKLHLQVDSVAEASEAFYRMSHALAEVKKFMVPDEGGGMMQGGGMGGMNPMGGGGWGAPPMGGGGPGFMPRGGPRGGRGGPPRGRGGDRGGGGRGFRGGGGGGRGGPPRGGGRGGGQFNGGDGSNGFAGGAGGGDPNAGGAAFDGTYEGFGNYEQPAQQQWGGGKMGGRGGGPAGGAPY